jgi:hypothetical protein
LVAFDSPYNFACVGILQNFFYSFGKPSTCLDPENVCADFKMH